ncbi:dihydrolipoyl dehydrogenase [Sphingomonas morindae]|uniref:Dihydrolipoyl dehydrogenase n=1 Tax=Sphingomonas morindae TaxID=1541170 RepID=A0ABY4X8S3_9SPHN|nr:dihydrolipoyl dehydrogenase [Sphingomonas morindae]USI73278.1 dihydrolipoyl dehydrogenase [Sphingomonas morindae]
MTLIYDVAVIGAGTAGLAAERAARAAGANTLLIDPQFAGTTCARCGCMPSKLLIAAARAAQAVRRAPDFGVGASAPAVDGRAVMKRVRDLRDRFTAGVEADIAALPEGVKRRGSARFLGPTRLGLDDGAEIEARAVVIATGARPALPPAFAALGDRALTHESLFTLTDLPARLGVIGAGPLGLELAQAFARLGVEVAVFDQGQTLGGVAADGPIGAALRDVLTRDLALHLDTEVIAEAEGDGVRLRWHGASQGSLMVDRLLVATGRPPALDELDLAATGLVLPEDGSLPIDPETLQLGAGPLFMAGDADGVRPVLHEASTEGAIAGRNAALYPQIARVRRDPPFSILFTEPSLALIGETDRADALIGESDYRDQGRATIDGVADGLARLHAAPDGRLIGAEIFAPGAEHLGHLLAWAIADGLAAHQLLDRPFYHPTLEEGLKPALRALCARAGTMPPAERDEGSPAGP